MTEKVLPRKNWILDQKAFDGLLLGLNPDPARAAQIYESTRKKLMKYFEWHGCMHPGECTDKTLDRVARKIMEGVVIGETQGYIRGVASHVLMEYRKESQVTVVCEENALPDASTLDDRRAERLALEHLDECLSECTSKLPLKSRELIERYYQEEKAEKIKRRKEMTGTENISSNALRIRTLRIRRKLKECIEGCLRQKTEMAVNSNTL